MYFRQARELIAAVELLKLGASSFLATHLCASLKTSMIRNVIRSNKMDIDRSRLTKNYTPFLSDPRRFVHTHILDGIRQNLRQQSEYEDLFPAERFLKIYQNYVSLAEMITPDAASPLLNPNQAWVALGALDSGTFQKRVCEHSNCSDVYITFHQSDQTKCHPCNYYESLLCARCHEKLPDEFLDKRTGPKHEYCPSCKSKVRAERRRDTRRRKRGTSLAI